MARGGYRRQSAGRWSGWAPYVPVAERRAEAEREAAALRRKGRAVSPVVVAGRRIADTFWGAAWCAHLESYSDYANRLPRGRTYVRNGSVLHLEIGAGRVEALVRGSRTYTVTIAVEPLRKARWQGLVAECSGQVTSLVELLQGKLSDGVMAIVTDRERGLFPSPKEIRLSCSCPDWATMCKHVAAVMYGVGARLDTTPELLFRLRAVDPSELLPLAAVGRSTTSSRVEGRTLAVDTLGSVFGIEIDESAPVAAPAAPRAAPKAGGGARKTRAPRTAATSTSSSSERPSSNGQARRSPKAAVTAAAYVTLSELGAAGVTLGELADMLADGTLEATRTRESWKTSAAVRAKLLAPKPDSERRARTRRARG